MGYFAEVYNFESGHSNILVFDNGRLIYQTAGKDVDDNEVRSICQKILASKK